MGFLSRRNGWHPTPAPAALSFADRCYILNKEHILYEGAPAQLDQQREILHKYLGVNV